VSDRKGENTKKARGEELEEKRAEPRG